MRPEAYGRLAHRRHRQARYAATAPPTAPAAKAIKKFNMVILLSGGYACTLVPMN
jgi:hypothetical protein